MYNLKSLFGKKQSQYFRSQRYKSQKPDVIIPGRNLEHDQALKVDDVLTILNSSNTQAKMIEIAQNLGCSNVQCASFHIESWIVSDDRGDDYDPYGVDRDFFFLIATEK